MTHQSLEGYWTGIYDYANGTPAIPFTLVMHEKDGVISGEIIEPHPEKPGENVHVFASIAGSFTQGILSFDKVYETDKVGRTVKLRYTGFADDTLSHIEGSWNFILKHGGYWNSGNFTMRRKEDVADSLRINVASLLQAKK